MACLRLISDDEVEKYAAFTMDVSVETPLNDPRFGSAGSMSFDCPTCGASESTCIGHCGMLALNCDIFHPLVYTSVTNILNRTCLKCKTRHINKKTHKCHSCGSQLHRDYFISHKSFPYAVLIKSENTILFNDNSRRTVKLPSEVKHVLPDGYVISKILVPPVSMRTPYDMEWPSALHKYYLQILQVIKKYSSSKDKSREICDEYANEVSLKYQRILGSNKREGIIGMLGSKRGIFRQIMLGKRVDNCARAVISPDPCVDIDEVAVPRVIARQITVKVLVSKANISHLRHLAQDGQLWWREECLAHPEHVVEGLRLRRVLKDGDYALFNRQPSLSRSSLLCFRVRIRTDNINTFGMNPQAVGPFNADFDGDEMNMFFGVFSDETYEELRDICHVSNNVVIDGRVELTPVQDVITGCYMMSLEDQAVSKTVADQCEMYFNRSDIFHYISHKHRFWADIVENDDNYEETVTTYSLLRACFPAYKDGEKITKKYITNAIRHEHNPLEFIQRLQAIVLLWLSEEGLSVPLQSLIIKSGKPIMPNQCTEEGINVVQFQRKCEDIVRKELHSSHVMCMVESGAKGQMLHLQHISIALGQQIVLGKAGVFCHNSYVDGLTPDEFFGHQMAAREGVVRTGVSTAESGYLNRKCCKIMADLCVQPNNAIGDPYMVSTFDNLR